MSADRRRQGTFAARHGLGLAVAAIVVAWLLLYIGSDPDSHWGAFFGNAIADWLGTLMLVIATKYFYEVRSSESRPPHPNSRSRLARFLIDHSLTIVLLVTGGLWVAAFARMKPDGKAGQVVGNIASEWVQVLGLVVMTKYLGEARSKEGG